MSNEKEDLVDRLDAMVKELPTSFHQVVLEAGSEIERLRTAVKQGDKDYRQEVAALNHANGQIKELSAENNNLRDQLHHLTVENARHEGYLDRVFEFDPVSDKRVYQDQKNPIFVQPPDEMHRVQDGYAANFTQSIAVGERRMPWYRMG